MNLEELVNKAGGIDFKSTEKKVLQYIVGVGLGVVAIGLIQKFISDNYSFYIPRIANRPDPYHEENK